MSGAGRGCRGIERWQVDWEPDHFGPQSRVPALPLEGVRGIRGLGGDVGVIRGLAGGVRGIEYGRGVGVHGARRVWGVGALGASGGWQGV